MRRRPALVAVAALVLTGCGGSDDGAPVPAPEAGTTSTPSATDTAEEAADPAAYLPVPDGSELTEPGAELAFREPALVAWRPRQDVVGVVGVSVQRVERTTVERSLTGFELDEAEAASTPYFVTVQVGNGGETDLGGRQLPVYVVDSEQRLVAPTGIDPAFEPCPGSTLPAIFAPGDEARSCLIFLVPSGAELEQVMFRPPEGVVPITWTGKVRDLADPGRRPRRDKGRAQR